MIRPYEEIYLIDLIFMHIRALHGIGRESAHDTPRRAEIEITLF